MSLPPIEIPLGAMRFNSDSQKLEYWNGGAWFQIKTFSPNFGNSPVGVRGLWMGKFDDSSNTGTIDFITISSTGNATDYGDLINSYQFYGGACSSHTRWVQFGGHNGNHTDQMQYGEISTTGNGIDFGDLQNSTQYNPSGVGNKTRGIRMGGSISPSGGAQNNMDYWQYQTTGNAFDFGDLVAAKRFSYSANSPTRGILSGGDHTNPALGDAINQYVLIASKGDAFTFGDLSSVVQYVGGNGACCNAVKGMFGGGGPKPGTTKLTDIEAIFLSTFGESFKFGDLSVGRNNLGSTSSATRGVWAGGYSPSYVNTIDYLNIATGGTAVDFGDRTVGGSYLSGCSNGHGGLG